MSETPADRYSIELAWSDDDAGFVGRVPELPGCCFVGETRVAAMTEAPGAIAAWIEACRDIGRPVPDPRINPEPPEFLPILPTTTPEPSP